MKRARILNLIVAAVAVATLVSGCKKGTRGITQIPPTNVSGPGDMSPTGPINSDPGPGAGVGIGNGADPITSTPGGTPLPENRKDYKFEDRDVFKQQTVYFELDRSAVRPTEGSKIEAVAAYLKNQPATAVEIEGHCDERGTEEYNRSLGERRALATREYLLSLGIAPGRVFTISYGEDKAADPGHDDAAWAKNRRAEFILLKVSQ